MFEVLSIKAGQADPAQFDRASTRMTVTITIIYTTSQPCFFILMSDEDAVSAGPSPPLDVTAVQTLNPN